MKKITNGLKHLLLLIIFLYGAFAFMHIASYRDIVKSPHSNSAVIHLLAIIYVMTETSLIILFGMIFSEAIVYEV